MKSSFWNSGVASVAIAALAILPGNWLRGQELELLNLNNLRPSHVNEDGNPLRDGHVQPVQLSEYWIGVLGGPVDEALAAQLQLPENQGYMIQTVVPESPAVKAGLKRFDIVLKIDGENVRELADIVKAVDAHQDEEMKLTILRKGQETTLHLQPEKRPTEAQAGPPGFRQFGNQQMQNEMRQWMERMPNRDRWLDRGLRLNFYGPGWVDRGQFGWTEQLKSKQLTDKHPDGLSIQIQKDSDSPARIHVQRGDETWDVTEEELDQLPEDLREYVQQFLGRSGNPVWYFDNSDGNFKGRFGQPRAFSRPNRQFDGDFSERMDKRFEELERRMEKLFERLESRQDTP